MTVEPVKKKRPVWHWIVGAIGLLFLCGIVSTLTGDDADPAPVANAPTAVEDEPAAPADTDEPEVPTAEPTAAPRAPAWAAIKAFRESATDVGWDAYRETLAGTRADGWTGIVTEVKAKGQNYEVWVDLDSNTTFNIQNTQILTSDPAVAMWSKDAPVVVSGVIERVDSMLGSVQVDFEDGATVTAAP